MKTVFKLAFLGTTSALLLCADFGAPVPLRVSFVPEALAVIGLPRTPLSVAGVARRTAVRTTAVVATTATASAAAQQQAAAQQHAAAAQQQAAAAQPAPAPPIAPPPAAAGQPLPLGTVVHALPGGCVQTPVGGVEYYYCGGNFFRAAFEGNSLVYVTAKP